MVFAAHINEEKIQTVGEHCRNTAEMAAGFARVFDAENIGRLQGLLHDIGKLCEKFSRYIMGESSTKRGEIDHSFAGAKYLCETADRADPKRFYNVSRLIARTIISHHGLNDWLEPSGVDYFLKRTGKTELYDEIRKNADELFSEKELLSLLESADDEYKRIRAEIKEISNGEKEKFAFYLGMLERILQSALIDADRIDTASFMSCEPAEISADKKQLWTEMKVRLAERLSSFDGKTDPISKQRKSISDRCAEYAKNDVKVCRMIVPTGGGKTLSSLRFAIEYCIGHDMEKMIYIAPFMSILEQNSDEFRAVSGEENFLEHHSNVVSERFEKAEQNEYSEYELHTERWDSPVIATTMVQFLNTLFSAKTSSVRRMHRLSKAVIIIDEIQAVPLKCVNMLNLAVNFLTQICGSTVVLCSATQPVMDEVKFPVIMDEKYSMTGDFTEDFEVFRRTDIVSKIDPYGWDYDEAAEFCAEKFRESGDLLLIVNTKSEALAMFERIKELCKDEAEIIHLSTNMCPEHRRDRIKHIREQLNEKRPIICVTTQLIEAGVDISFRCVVRALAGLDNAVQAAGRCNRHGDADGIWPVYIIKFKNEKLGSLTEIKDAQGILQGMLGSGRYADLQSDEAIRQYFRSLYQTESGKLCYTASDNGVGTNLIDLLSLDTNRYEISERTSSKFTSQAFRTAGTIFTVIDNNTEDIVVPYNDEAKELIEKLMTAENGLVQLTKQAQKYTVSVYGGTGRKLDESNGIYRTKFGTAILEKNFYDSELGIITEGAEQDILIY